MNPYSRPTVCTGDEHNSDPLFGDSDMVSQQVSGTWDSKGPVMAAYRREVSRQAGFFTGYQVDHADRRKNEAADALSRLRSRRNPVPPNVYWMSYCIHLSSPLRSKT